MKITSISYPYTFNTSNKKVNISESATSVGECLSLLLTTAKGELLGEPNYGTHLFEYLYEKNNAVLEELVKTDIVDNVRIYEPRIDLQINDIEIVEDENTVYIKLKYFLKDEGTYSNYSLAVLKEEQ